MSAVETGRCQGICFVTKNDVSQVELFVLSGTIPDTVCTKKRVLPPFYSGQRDAPPNVRPPERGRDDARLSAGAFYVSDN